MILIYHKTTLQKIGQPYHNHDQANTALSLMTEQHIISTINLAVADETELEYLRHSKTVQAPIKTRRGPKLGQTCPFRGMTMEAYRKSKVIK